MQAMKRTAQRAFNNSLTAPMDWFVEYDSDDGALLQSIASFVHWLDMHDVSTCRGNARLPPNRNQTWSAWGRISIIRVLGKHEYL